MQVVALAISREVGGLRWAPGQGRSPEPFELLILFKIGRFLGGGWQQRYQIQNEINCCMAEREGFEPPIGLHLCRISSAVHSTTLPPLLKAPR